MLGRAPEKNVVLLPGDSIVVKLVSSLPDGLTVAVEPRVDTRTFQRYHWPSPNITKVVADEIVVPNQSSELITVKKK